MRALAVMRISDRVFMLSRSVISVSSLEVCLDILMVSLKAVYFWLFLTNSQTVASWSLYKGGNLIEGKEDDLSMFVPYMIKSTMLRTAP